MVDWIEHDTSSRSRRQGGSGGSSSSTTEGSSEESGDNNSGNDTTSKTSSEGDVNRGSWSEAIDSTSSIKTSTDGRLIVSKNFLKGVVITIVDFLIDCDDSIWKSLNALTLRDVDTDSSVGAVIWAFWWGDLGWRNTGGKSVIEGTEDIFVAFSRVKTVGVVWA